MTNEELLIAAVRIAASLLVLRWAFAGAIVAILADFGDLFLKSYLDLGGVRDYQAFDKWLDQVYMVAFLAIAMRWSGPARAIALWLFCFRLIGVALFEITGERGLLLAFPNVFEFWFVFVAFQRHWLPRWKWDEDHVARAFVVVTAAKLGQEYLLHANRWLDTFSAAEAVDAVIGALM